MSQSEIDDAEWKNPDNWAGAGPLKVYFSKRDSRLWVPRYNWWLSSSTINFGHRYGIVMLTFIQWVAFAIWIFAIITMKR